MKTINQNQEAQPHPLVVVGQWFMTNGGQVSSSIRALEVNEQGVRFQRINPYYNGETFFLTWGALQSSLWVPVPNGRQLEFL